MRYLPVALLLSALPLSQAHADVLEIGASGAQWIAGGTPAPPATADSGLARIEGEVSARELSAPALTQAALPPRYQAAVVALAERFDLSPALLEALVWQESRWHEGAVSPVGARGLAQLMPDTARELGVNPDDPLANLEGGARYLRQQLDRFDGDIEKALAAYNAGPGRVEQAGGVPRIRETQQYVAAVMGRLSDHSRSDD